MHLFLILVDRRNIYSLWKWTGERDFFFREKELPYFSYIIMFIHTH